VLEHSSEEEDANIVSRKMVLTVLHTNGRRVERWKNVKTAGSLWQQASQWVPFDLE